jgi:hypothetical protein
VQLIAGAIVFPAQDACCVLAGSGVASKEVEEDLSINGCKKTLALRLRGYPVGATGQNRSQPEDSSRPEDFESDSPATFEFEREFHSPLKQKQDAAERLHAGEKDSIA